MVKQPPLTHTSNVLFLQGKKEEEEKKKKKKKTSAIPQLKIIYLFSCENTAHVTSRESYPSTWAQSQAGLPGGSEGKECKRHKFDPWVGKISWRRKWQRTPVFLPEKSHRHGISKNRTQLSNYTTQPGQLSQDTKGRGFRVAWRALRCQIETEQRHTVLAPQPCPLRAFRLWKTLVKE